MKETVTRLEDAVIATRVRTSTWGRFHCGKKSRAWCRMDQLNARSPTRDRLHDYRRRVKFLRRTAKGAYLAAMRHTPVFSSQRLATNSCRPILPWPQRSLIPPLLDIIFNFWEWFIPSSIPSSDIRSKIPCMMPCEAARAGNGTKRQNSLKSSASRQLIA